MTFPPHQLHEFPCLVLQRSVHYMRRLFWEDEKPVCARCFQEKVDNQRSNKARTTERTEISLLINILNMRALSLCDPAKWILQIINSKNTYLEKSAENTATRWCLLYRGLSITVRKYILLKKSKEVENTLFNR